MSIRTCITYEVDVTKLYNVVEPKIFYYCSTMFNHLNVTSMTTSATHTQSLSIYMVSIKKIQFCSIKYFLFNFVLFIFRIIDSLLSTFIITKNLMHIITIIPIPAILYHHLMAFDSCEVNGIVNRWCMTILKL